MKRSILNACIAAVVGWTIGCCSGPEFGEVEGVVTLNGQPLANVEIAFLPDPAKGNNGPRAVAYTDEQGHYKLRTERSGKDGAVLGAHRVCFTDLTAVKSFAASLGNKAVPPGKPGGDTPTEHRGSRIPAAYGDAARTPAHADVKPGRQTLNFDIPSGPGK